MPSNVTRGNRRIICANRSASIPTDKEIEPVEFLGPIYGASEATRHTMGKQKLVSSQLVVSTLRSTHSRSSSILGYETSGPGLEMHPPVEIHQRSHEDSLIFQRADQIRAQELG
ncbi:hypothetical protein X801_07793 [Opisthorchis viverrini]|uniref:Uncharacterized protein n=1 Tax=Opisthorchis viverrini TaxID=6198 RepID=A0A1S8WPP8_OPIVI|nr:hypothetical protein X801_07793 [Opisthorchis viverrini]